MEHPIIWYSIIPSPSLPKSAGALLLRWDESFRTEQLGGGHVAVAVGEEAAGDKAPYELAQERRIGFDPERDVAVVGPPERAAELQRRTVEGLAAVLGESVEAQ